MRALYTLVKDILFVIMYICSELNIPLLLPAVITEDNSAVVTVSNEESAYLKTCKHLIMVVNYVREQLELGLIQVLKIKGELNNADLLNRESNLPPRARGHLFMPQGHCLETKGHLFVLWVNFLCSSSATLKLFVLTHINLFLLKKCSKITNSMTITNLMNYKMMV